MILVGELSLWVALLMAAWAATVSFAGGQLRRNDLIESGERAIYATLAMVVLASIGLWTALITHETGRKRPQRVRHRSLTRARLLPGRSG